VNQTTRKTQPNSDCKSKKKRCKEKQTKHIFLAKQPNRDCIRKKHVAKFVKYCGAFLTV